MPLLDHFHPPLHGPRRWEGFHHAWAASIAKQLNEDTLPPDYYAEPEISIGPELEVDVATLEKPPTSDRETRVATAVWTPPRPKLAVAVEFSRMDNYEVRVFRDIGDVDLRAAIELVSPANKDRPGSRQTFAAKCAGYIQHGISVVIIDVVTSRPANLHAELFDLMEVKGSSPPWKSRSGLYAIAYRAVTTRKRPRVEVWPEPLALGDVLPTVPLWLTLDLCVPVRLEESYTATCRSLRISA